MICCTPRQHDESYHQIALVGEPQTPFHLVAAGIYESRAKALGIKGKHSLYREGEPVGKSTAQVGRALDGTISVNDSELYEKWGQCLSSATDLVSRTYWDGKEEKEAFLSAVFPFVVVPNGRLWMVAFDDDGNQKSEPEVVNRISCYINKQYEMGSKVAGTKMRISHVEIVTFDGMKSFVETYLKDEDGIRHIFPIDGIQESYLQSVKVH